MTCSRKQEKGRIYKMKHCLLIARVRNHSIKRVSFLQTSFLSFFLSSLVQMLQTFFPGAPSAPHTENTPVIERSSGLTLASRASGTQRRWQSSYGYRVLRTVPTRSKSTRSTGRACSCSRSTIFSRDLAWSWGQRYGCWTPLAGWDTLLCSSQAGHTPDQRVTTPTCEFVLTEKRKSEYTLIKN